MIMSDTLDEKKLNPLLYTECCLNCGIANTINKDGTKTLKICGGCRKVKYCSLECMKENRSQHANNCIET